MSNLSSQAPTQVVSMTTCGAACHGKFAIMATFGIQWNKALCG